MKTSKYGKLLDIRHLPMDYGRFACIPLRLFGFRTKKLSENGKRYRNKVRGGAVIVSNHIDFFDPLALITTFLSRRVFFFASEEVMGNDKGFLKTLMTGMGCIKIDRNTSDINAIRTGCEIVKGGHTLAIFAQGHIQKSGNFETFKGGAVLIAAKAGVPIIPVYLSQRKHWWQRKVVVIGEPFDCKERCQKAVPSISDINTLTNDLLSEMKKLKAVCESNTKNQP